MFIQIDPRMNQKDEEIIMKKTLCILLTLVLFCLCGLAIAQRELGNEEILSIFRTLTDQPRDTWISNGIIHARHLEFKASDGLIMESTVTVKYDGNRFYWEINMDSCNTEQQVRQKKQRDRIDMGWNAKRVFVWDGEKYTMYFRPGNHAIVTEDTSEIPVAVNGPLTAGVIPWGYGIYTYENLSTAEFTAVESEEAGQKEIHMTVNMPQMPQILFVLDPVKNYAVMSCTLNRPGLSVGIKTYSNYRQYGNRWIPETVEIEKYDDSHDVPELLSFDHWRITYVSTSITEPVPFGIDYDADAYIEHFTPTSEKPLAYYFSNDIDTEWLRQERLSIMASQKTEKQNCATVALQHVLKELGKEPPPHQLSALVDERGVTSLDKMKQLASEMSLHSRAVRTNINTLRNLQGCQAILHLPNENHFVVLDHVDDENIWLIDLDRNRFYFPIPIEVFGLDWPTGTALLISKNEINLQEGIKEISENALRKIVGADSFGNYSCTKLLQKTDYRFCQEMIAGSCTGRYRWYFPRLGCELAVSGNSCNGNGSGMVGSVWGDCVEDLENAAKCISSGECYSQSINACGSPQ